MKITIIIPMYNSENTIIDALDSIKSQTRLDSVKEIIIINDGSTDNSEFIVKEYINNHTNMPIKLVTTENRGVSSARNLGMKMATSEWIALLDSDDIWLPHKLERQIAIIENEPSIDFLGCGYNDATLRIMFKPIRKLYRANIKDLCIKMFPVTPSALFKRDIFNEIGGFNETLRYAEDGNYFMQICLKYRYYYLPENLVSIGHGKRPFGDKGLSANLKGMYQGNIYTINNLASKKEISIPFYLFLRVFYLAKYIRRKVITCLYR